MNKKDNFQKIVQRALDYYEFSLNPSTMIGIFPDHVGIEPTNSCNLRCIHCHHSGRGDKFTKKTWHHGYGYL